MLPFLAGLAVLMVYGLVDLTVMPAGFAFAFTLLVTLIWMGAAWHEQGVDWLSRLTAFLAFVLYFVHLRLNWTDLTYGATDTLTTTLIAVFVVLVPLCLFIAAPVRLWLAGRE